MGILDFLFGNDSSVNWDEVKSSEKVYPNNSISLITLETGTGKPATGWIDLGYINYEYKKQCPFNLQFSIEIDDASNIDYGEVEDYFINKLQEGAIAHPVSRVVTDFGFIMDIYVDDVNYASEILSELYESKDKLYEFGCGVNKDKKWKEYNKIIKLVENE